ncbi:hypothetical protein RB614_12185 [Phytohabitans sp. ZYX-F-186]|uniref:Uncharacterized protein n=1 Tax=Phytohabitans maris TaxID=3071409 RepID=A0ABU0ZE02_9ACTN|nr:hypothetical protein [Phytohabitans sp. ZYX-F-186]MDQ7905284.1 hypothetical protein [Phytohabitans sp. ZYX-F-186]
MAIREATLLLTVPLIPRRASGTRRPLAWLFAPLVAVFLLPTNYDVTIGVQPWAALAVMIGFMLWVLVDARGGYGQPEILAGAWFWTFTVGTAALPTTGAVALHAKPGYRDVMVRTQCHSRWYAGALGRADSYHDLLGRSAV